MQIITKENHVLFKNNLGNNPDDYNLFESLLEKYGYERGVK